MFKRYMSICALVCLGAMACEAAPVESAAAVAVSVAPAAAAAAVEAAPQDDDESQAQGGSRLAEFKPAMPAPTRHLSIEQQQRRGLSLKTALLELELHQQALEERARAISFYKAKEKWKAKRAKANEDAVAAAESNADALVRSVKGDQGAMLR